MDLFELPSYTNYERTGLLKNQMENLNARLVSIVKSKQLSPGINIDSEKQEILNELDSSIHIIQVEIAILQQIPRNVLTFEEIRFKQAVINNYRDFKNYAEEVIEDYQNVIIMHNTDIIKCVKRRIEEPFTRAFGNDSISSVVYRRASSPQRRSAHEDTESDIIFVIFEDHETDQYYGIDLEGNKAVGNISDYEDLSEPLSCNFFIIKDSRLFAEKILDIQTDTKKKLLFENQFFKYVTINCFKSYHNHAEDSFANWMTGPCDACRGIIREQIQDSKLQNYKFSQYLLNDIAQSYTREPLSRIPIYPVHCMVWGYFLLYFDVSNSNNQIYKRKKVLQQFKCLFTKDSNDEKKLYQKIENHIYPRKPLIELFLPEIKFLMHRFLYNKFNIPDPLQSNWVEYVGDHSQPVDTSPKTFLHYLLNVVLSNLLSREVYDSLLITLSNITITLSDDMTKRDGHHNYSMIKDIIDRVILKYKLKQEAGKIVNNKNVSRTKKNSKLVNNKITSRQKKISRKHKN